MLCHTASCASFPHAASLPQPQLQPSIHSLPRVFGGAPAAVDGAVAVEGAAAVDGAVG